MNLTEYNGSIEEWFLKQGKAAFPDDGNNYITKYGEIVQALKPVHKSVTAGADSKDGTSLTWHDESHIKRVIKQVSKLLEYTDAKISPYEAFALLVAIQIHDVKNIEGREGHEDRAIEIFADLKIPGIIDSVLKKNIGFIASCHAGSILIGERKEKDKISLLAPTVYKAERQIRLRFLAALLRLADEYADDSERAMNFLLEIGKIKEGSIIHQKHAQSLLDVSIEKDSGKVDFDYHVSVEDAVKKFPKYIKHKDTFEDVFLLDEIFERTLKSHYETVYCMRFLRPDIRINRLHISIEIEHLKLTEQLKINYELEEKGYPNSELSILDICGEKYLKVNGGYWSGYNLMEYINALNGKAVEKIASHINIKKGASKNAVKMATKKAIKKSSPKKTVKKVLPKSSKKIKKNK